MNHPTSQISRRRFLSASAAAGIAAAGCSKFGVGGASEDESTIRFITPADLGLERNLYRGFIRDFEDANPEYHVDVTFEAWDDYMTKLPTLLAGGAVPDLVHQHMSIVQDYGQRGALLDLASRMKEDDVRRDDYIAALFDAFTDGEKVYGIPKDSAAWGVYYNKAKFDDAGLDYPADDWSLDDFHEAVQRLTVDKAGRRPGDASFDPGKTEQWGMNWLAPGPTESENVRGFVKAAGGDWYDADYTETLITERPNVDHFTMFSNIRCGDGGMPSPTQEFGQGDPFRAGLTAMTVGFHSTDFFLRDEKADFDWGVTFLPSGPGGQFVPVGCSGWAIAAKAQNPDGAWSLLRHLVSAKVQREIASQKRWGPSVRAAATELVPDQPVPGFAKVHIDALAGNSDRTVISFKFPADQSRIQQAYSQHFDPIWTTCSSTDITGAAAATKKDVDEILTS